MAAFKICIIAVVVLVAILEVKYINAKPVKDGNSSEEAVVGSEDVSLEDLHQMMEQYDDLQSRVRRSVDDENEFAYDPMDPLNSFFSEDDLPRERRQADETTTQCSHKNGKDQKKEQ